MGGEWAGVCSAPDAGSAFFSWGVVFRECWAGLGVLLGKLQGDATSDESNGGAAEGSGGAADYCSKGEREAAVVVVRNNGTRNG